jgi:hypothetical protein
MKRFISLAVCVVFVMGFAGVAAAAKDTTGPAVGRDYSGYHFAQDGANNVLTSSSTSGVRFKANAFTDTFCIYGRKGAVNTVTGGMNLCGTEGRFDTGNGVVPQTLHHNQGCDELSGVWPASECWLGVDLTDQPTLWQVAPNALITDQNILDCISTLGIPEVDETPQNHVAWAGQSDTQQPGWTAGTGYGNNWNAILQWQRTLNNANVPQVVGLDFYFHHDSEPAYDFFNVQYDSFGTVIVVYTVDGSNAPFAAPGVHYPVDTASAEPINYEANGYGGALNNEITIQMTGTSDGAWSDEDGLWPTECGLAMVDDITVTYSEGSSYDNFDGPAAFTEWSPIKAPFVGDFSAIHPRLTDIDPCRENETPVAAFIDYGQCPKNGVNNCGLGVPGVDCQATGGTTSPNHSYGIPGGWVNDYNGGISGGLADLTNEVWSPPIDWDPTGVANEPADLAGSFLSFTVWRHLPLLNGQFYVWHVRSTVDDVIWSPFDDRNFVYYSNGGNWLNVFNLVSDLVNVGGGKPLKVQIGLGVTDLASLFAFPGTDATPSPAFDNVAYCKFTLQGPVFATRNIDLFMEAFPQSGNFDWVTLAGRQNSDCRIDMRDVSSGALNIPGDSTICDIVSAIPGFTLDRVDIKWIMDKNPLFDDARVMPAGTTVIPGGALNGWDQWTGSAPGDTSKVRNSGAIVQDRFFFDLPDADFAHPGDVIRWHLEAEDSGARISTLPGNIDGFATGRDANGQLYAPNFTLHFLPSVVDNGMGGQTQPWVLVWNDFGFRGGINDYYQAFEQNGWRRGIEWDMYTTWGPTSSVSNGLGSQGAHGATPDQIGGYDAMVYFVGDLGTTTMSDGSDSGNNDKGDDLSLMQAWFDAPGQERYVAHFGDDLVDALLVDSPGAGGTYVSTVMGVSFGDGDVKDEINNQSAPRVQPSGVDPCFVANFVAFGGCLGPNDFDSIDALAGGPVRTHEFLTPGGAQYGGPNRAASIAWNQGAKKSITFPYGFVYVWNESGSVRTTTPPVNPGGGPASQRGILLKEILECYFPGNLGPGGGPVAVDGPRLRPEIGLLSNRPNPYNPSTTIKFAVGVKQDVRVDMYNIRGELVATIHNGPMEAGPREVVWQGTDSRGVPVSSGVYIARVQGKYNTQQIKTMLVK